MRAFSIMNRPFRLAAAAAAVGLSLAVLLPQAASASSTGFPGANRSATESGGQYNITSSNYGLVAHVCKVAGSVSVYTGVFCADVYAEPEAGTTDVKVWSTVEGYCEDSSFSALPECPEVAPEMEYFIDGTGYGSFYPTPCDVHVSGDACAANARNYFNYTAWELGAKGDCHKFQTEVWGTTDGVIQSEIELPGDYWEPLGSSFTSGAAAKVCDEM